MSSIYSRRYLLSQSLRAIAGLSVASLANSKVWAGVTENKQSMSAVTSNLERQIPQLMQQLKIAGLSLAIIEDKKIFWYRSFGFKNYRSKHPLTNDTIFAAASLSKPLFAYGVLKLIERGMLDLDTPLTEYTAKPYIKDPRLRLITPRQVLCHTTGFPNWSGNRPVWIESLPGTKFSYSGEAYLYLQKVIAEITQQPFNQYIYDLLLAPLGMNNSSYIWQANYQYLAADGHDRNLNPSPMRRPTTGLSAGSLRTSAVEYAKFMIAMMQSGTIDSHLLTEESMQQMLRSHIQLNYYLDWGLGWGLEYSANQKYFWHWGDGRVYKTFAIASRKSGRGVVVLSNSQNGLKICPTIVSQVMSGDRYALNFEEIEY